MKRTTVYLDPEQEVLLKLEVQRRRRPMAELIREALSEYLQRSAPAEPPGAGDFASGRGDTAADAEAALRETGFGRS